MQDRGGAGGLRGREVSVGGGEGAADEVLVAEGDVEDGAAAGDVEPSEMRVLVYHVV